MLQSTFEQLLLSNALLPNKDRSVGPFVIVNLALLANLLQLPRSHEMWRLAVRLLAKIGHNAVRGMEA